MNKDLKLLPKEKRDELLKSKVYLENDLTANGANSTVFIIDRDLPKNLDDSHFNIPNSIQKVESQNWIGISGNTSEENQNQ